MNPEVKEILEYLRKCTKMNTSQDEFSRHLEKYDLMDILEAREIRKKEIEK
jgi:hypothetical protein